ncbi:SgcJ/EcaC family oxidoreductase [Massilia sp. DJPM01]|uniref:SgcJ/EcaC family oxidoreductase n=1 Tax=Massilia sp. DJPM01 TaxID=3024404 RepID=UPI00259E749E|nr:SgcJ/EcaC family oxidoreductase [Massilia sp. DJPM01]MDM5180875.1 SgcJ/EcaC family oxidoreductase [Massilia sp. DJPM01]
MKKLILAASLFACSLAYAKEPPRVYGNEAVAPVTKQEREIAGLFGRWRAALGTGKPAEVVKLYHPKAVLQPTVSNLVRTTPAEIEDYFVHFLELKPHGVINSRHIQMPSKDSAVDSGVYTFDIVKEGKPAKVQARYTFVYKKLGKEWLILKHHSSAMPEQVALN